MKRLRITFLSMWLLVATGTPSLALAAVLALTPNVHGDVHVIDTESLYSSIAQAADCCAVQAGSVAARPGNDRVYFIANDGVAQLFALDYGLPGSVASIGIGGGNRISHMAYDALRQRLVALLVADNGTTSVGALDPASGIVTITGVLDPDCCVLRSGVVAYSANADLLYAIGRRSADSTDQLFAFAVTTGTLQAAYPLGTAVVAQLLFDNGTLYALAYDPPTDTLRPATITFAPGFALNTIGTGSSGCCYVLAGSMARDGEHKTLVAITRASSASAAPFAIRSFSLANGSATIGNALTANGLFYDGNASLLDRIFADGFE